MSGTQPPNQEVTATEEGEPPELDAWLAGFGAEALKAELDALGAESVEDIKELDHPPSFAICGIYSTKVEILKAEAEP